MKAKLKLFLYNLDSIITGAAMIGMTLVVLLNVFCRYFANKPLVWGEEVATTLFVWSIFAGGEVCFRQGTHLGVDFLVRLLPDRIRSAFACVINAVVILIIGTLAVVSLTYMWNSRMNLSKVMQVTVLWNTVPVAVSFVVSLVWAILFFIRDLRTMTSFGKEAEQL
ncbi:TRAP transporter small permease [Caproiciproducens sp. NJN-50]|uniref:TRAP transporter small permease n=1 Tax=Caproiciproducens sp. NJN-50 TaxID=2507162 RepID=UPI000FFE2002|nr:TRAP transporter small permease [Caproiciproducens sp. NJN-50]QAT49038.1 TRAP transporter small permease [Caproiciproducens sp. NJN-50]